MKLQLLYLGLTLVCAHEGGHHEVVTSNFNMSKVLGEWCTVMLASDDKERIDENGKERIYVENIQELSNSSFRFTFHIKENGDCTEFAMILHPTENKDVYTAINNGYNLFNIVEAVYSEYLITYISNFKNDKETKFIELYAREPDLSPNLKKRFEELCLQQGIPKENILDVTNVDRCLHNRGSNGAQASRVV